MQPQTSFLSPQLSAGSNNPELSSLVAALHGEFRAAANGLSKGVKDVTLHAEHIIAILFLINKNAMNAPGINQTYSAEVGRAKGNIFGAKLFNYALSKIEHTTRENIDMMFGNVKAQMCQALDQLIYTYSPTVSPPLSELLEVIQRNDGIKGLGMAHMFRQGAERQAQRQKEETASQILREHERQQRETLAKEKGFASYEAFLEDENRKAEDMRFGKALGYLTARATQGEPTEGTLCILVEGQWRPLDLEDQKKILACVASLT